MTRFQPNVTKIRVKTRVGRVSGNINIFSALALSLLLGSESEPPSAVLSGKRNLDVASSSALQVTWQWSAGVVHVLTRQATYISAAVAEKCVM